MADSLLTHRRQLIKTCSRLAVLILTFSFASIGCGETEAKSDSAEGAKPAVEPTAGVISGTARTVDGRPIKAFGGSIEGYTIKSGETVSTEIVGVDGIYEAEVGLGQFCTRAWTDVEYNGRAYRIDLEAVDGKTPLTRQDTKSGLVKDYIWKLDGFRAGADARSYDRFYSHCGGSIGLNPEGHGVFYWSGIRGDHQHAPEPKIPADATVEMTLTPDGPLIDGSEGKVVILTIKGADIDDPIDRVTRGIPIGRYNATARAIHADGSIKPMRITQVPDNYKEKAAEPAESVVIEFVQSKPVSETVNGVDEIKVHLMY